MQILNLTQHSSTTDQLEVGVVDLSGKNMARLQEWLTFNELVSDNEIVYRSTQIALFAQQLGFEKAMIGGALWLMAPLTKALYAVGITPLFAFSNRETEEKSLPDGSVIKSIRFKHVGFVTAVNC